MENEIPIDSVLRMKRSGIGGITGLEAKWHGEQEMAELLTIQRQTALASRGLLIPLLMTGLLKYRY